MLRKRLNARAVSRMVGDKHQVTRAAHVSALRAVQLKQKYSWRGVAHGGIIRRSAKLRSSQAMRGVLISRCATLYKRAGAMAV